MTEPQFQRLVIQYATLNGWRVMHVSDSRREVKANGISRLVGDPLAKGWPDLVLVHPGRGTMLIRELKTDRGRISPEQREWLRALTACGVDAGVWRPRDLDEIEAALGRRRR